MIKIKGVFFLIDFHLSIKNFSVRTNFYLVAKRQKLKFDNISQVLFFKH